MSEEIRQMKRDSLKEYFTSGKRLNQEHFANLIDSVIVQGEDGVSKKSPTAPLEITAVGKGDDATALVLNDPKGDPAWTIGMPESGGKYGLQIGGFGKKASLRIDEGDKVAISGALTVGGAEGVTTPKLSLTTSDGKSSGWTVESNGGSAMEIRNNKGWAVLSMDNVSSSVFFYKNGNEKPATHSIKIGSSGIDIIDDISINGKMQASHGIGKGLQFISESNNSYKDKIVGWVEFYPINFGKNFKNVSCVSGLEIGSSYSTEQRVNLNSSLVFDPVAGRVGFYNDKILKSNGGSQKERISLLTIAHKDDAETIVDMNGAARAKSFSMRVNKKMIINSAIDDYCEKICDFVGKYFNEKRYQEDLGIQEGNKRNLTFNRTAFKYQIFGNFVQRMAMQNFDILDFENGYCNVVALSNISACAPDILFSLKENIINTLHSGTLSEQIRNEGTEPEITDITISSQDIKKIQSGIGVYYNMNFKNFFDMDKFKDMTVIVPATMKKQITKIIGGIVMNHNGYNFGEDGETAITVLGVCKFIVEDGDVNNINTGDFITYGDAPGKVKKTNPDISPEKMVGIAVSPSVLTIKKNDHNVERKFYTVEVLLTK